jgi:hypothetical protein
MNKDKDRNMIAEAMKELDYQDFIIKKFGLSAIDQERRDKLIQDIIG